MNRPTVVGNGQYLRVLGMAWMEKLYDTILTRMKRSIGSEKCSPGLRCSAPSSSQYSALGFPEARFVEDPT